MGELELRQCGTCYFWAQLNSTGHCGMPEAPESVVELYPLLRKKRHGGFFVIEENDPDLPEDFEFSAVLVTSQDFGCNCWQKREIDE